MGSRDSEADAKRSAEDLPEDVAALYSWAGIVGAKYREFPDQPIEPAQEFRTGSAKPRVATPSEIARTDARISPAWLSSAAGGPPDRTVEQVFQDERYSWEPTAHEPWSDTLVDWQSRVAARWAALEQVFAGSAPAVQLSGAGSLRKPLTLVFSLAGGVGKTSLSATLARALASTGDDVLLADTTGHGILPIYFRTAEHRDGIVRKVRTGGIQATEMSLVSYDFASVRERQSTRTCAESLHQNFLAHDRMIVDIGAETQWLLPELADAKPLVLVPINPDMNSILRLSATEQIFRGLADAESVPMLPYYVLNQFDASLALHLDVREVCRRQLGSRLLPVSIRRSPSVSEALAEGMTVLDYLPSAPVSLDYVEAAQWVSAISPLVQEEDCIAGWSGN